MTYHSNKEQLLTPPLQMATYADTFSETEVFRTPEYTDRGYLIKEAGFVVQDGATDANLTWRVYKGDSATGILVESGTGGIVERNIYEMTGVNDPLTMTLEYTGSTVTGGIWLIFTLV